MVVFLLVTRILHALPEFGSARQNTPQNGQLAPASVGPRMPGLTTPIAHTSLDPGVVA